MHKTIVLIILLMAYSLIKAQQNNTLFLMHDLPQANIVNPAVQIKCKLHIGIPLIGSTHINAYSTGFAFNDVFEKYNGDSLRFNPDKTLHQFNKYEIISSEVHLSLLSFGYKYRNNYFTFSVNEKVNSYSILSKNALLLANEGNSQFVGRNTNLGGTRINAVHYREYALGWAKNVNEKFDFGIRAKLLFGKANIYTKNTNISLYTDPITYALNLSASGELNSSFPLDLTTNEDGDIEEINDIEIKDINISEYLLNKNNLGMGVDLGIIYKIDQFTTLSASILDIGFIKWKSEIQNIEYSGQLDISGQFFEDGSSVFEALGDSLSDTFQQDINYMPYSSPLTPSIYFGIERKMTNNFELGTVFHNEFFKKKWHSSLSLSANKNFAKILSTGISYTIQNKQFNNIGMGMGIKLGPIYLHALSDNIPAFFNLSSARNINLRFGISLLTGCSQKNESNNFNKSHGAIPCTMGNPYKAIQRKRR